SRILRRLVARSFLLVMVAASLTTVLSLHADDKPENGLRRVTVSLRMDFIPEGRLSSTDRLQQRRNIRSSQEKIKRHFANGEAFEVHDFETIPAVSLRATPGL